MKEISFWENLNTRAKAIDMSGKKSMWESLNHKARQQAASIDLFKTLSERSKLENQRPQAIDFAEMEKVIEQESISKSKVVEIQKNRLNITYFVLKNPKSKQYFRIDEKEKFLWEKMDGMHTIRDLALEYFNQYGSFAYEKIVELVYDLKKKTFLTEEYVDIYQKLSLWAKSKVFLNKLWSGMKKFFSWQFPLKNVDNVFAFLYNKVFKVFFSKAAIIVSIFISLIGFGLFIIITQNSYYAIFHHNDSFTLGVIILFLLILFSFLLHELAHGLATKHFGRQVHHAGLMIYFGLPAFYVDTTDMWMEEKEKRMVVSFAGIYVDLFLAGLASLLLFFQNNLVLNQILFKFAFVQYVSFFINMNPLVEWDGYFILMDYLSIPCLRKRSLHFIQQELLTKIKEKQLLSNEEKIYSVFGILSAIWSVIAVFIGINFWEKQIKRLFS